MVDEGNPDGTQFWMLLSSPCQQFFAVLLIAQGVLRLYNFAPMVRELDAELGLQIFFWTVYIRIAVLIVPTSELSAAISRCAAMAATRAGSAAGGGRAGNISSSDC